MRTLPLKFSFLIITILMALGTAGRVNADEDNPADNPGENSRLLLLAENAYLTGLELEEEQKGSGRETLLQSAAYYQTLTEERDIRNGEIFFNLGNAYLSAGETGRAILAYKKAARFMPMNSQLKYNYNLAREKVINKNRETPRTQLKNILFFFHYDIPGKLKALIILILSLLFWGILILNLYKPGFLKLALIPLVPLIILGASLLWEAGSEKFHPELVLVAGKTEARKGDAASYAPAFDAPLGGGTTAIRLEDAGDWWQIQLETGDTCWIPAAAAELVSEDYR